MNQTVKKEPGKIGKRVRSAAGYLLAAGIGWAAVSFMRPQAAGVSAGAVLERKAAPQDEAAAAIVVLAKLDAARLATEGADKDKLTKNLEERIARRMTRLPPAQDPEAAARQAMAKLDGIFFDTLALDDTLDDRMDTAVRFLQWLQHDEAGALAAIKDLSTGKQLRNSGAIFGIETWARTADPEMVLAALPEKEGYDLSRSLCAGLGDQAGRTGDLALAGAMYERAGAGMKSDERAGAGMKSDLVEALVAAWPESRLLEMLPLGMEKKDPALLARALKRMPAREAFDWLRQLQGDGANMKLVQQIYQHGHGLFDGQHGIPLAEMLAFRTKQFASYESVPDNEEAQALRMEVGRAVMTLATDGQITRWIAAVRRGEMKGAELLGEVNGLLPEQAEAAPEEVKGSLFSLLAGQSPEAAVALYASLPERERYRKVTELFATRFAGTSVGKVQQILAQIPFNSEYGSREERAQMWTRMTGRAVENFGENYPDWVRRLPAGVDRELALTALADRLAKDDPELSAALRAETNEAR